MLPTSARHQGVGLEPPLQCGSRQHMLQPYRVQTQHARHVGPAPISCLEYSPLRAVQQADWACQPITRCKSSVCIAAFNSLVTPDVATHTVCGHCLSPAAHLAAHSRSRQRQLRQSQLLVVALDTNGSQNDSFDDHESPPEAGILPQDVERLRSNRHASTSAARHKTTSSIVKPIYTNPIITSSSVIGNSSSSSNSSSAASDSINGSSSSSSSSSAGNSSAVSSSNVQSSSAAAAGAAAGKQEYGVAGRTLYPPAERSQIQESWDTLMRWSKTFSKRQAKALSPIEATDKVVIFGGGSFGTAMGTALALKKAELDVVLLLRDPYLCKDINMQQRNSKYLPDFALPANVRATTDSAEAIAGASYAVHAVPVQHSRSFLASIKDVLPKDVPIICVSKGLEVGSGCMMSEVIPSALNRRQPAVFLSGPSFAKEVMQGRPTGVVAACKDASLAREIQELFASPNMRVNTSTDVTGVEICGALKNVLAIAAGIVEGLDLGHNALAALIAQGCAEIRWLSQKVGAKPATISGLSGLGDIMLTCYGDLSRNRSVGVRLGRGEKLSDILASSSQVAEGVATAGVVVGLARKYRVSLPVLTAVAQVLDSNLSPAEAVAAVMNLPQIEEH